MAKRKHACDAEPKGKVSLRLQYEMDQLGTWRFASEFPALATAVAEIQMAIEKANAERPDLKGDLLPVVKKWKKNNDVCREDVEALHRRRLLTQLEELIDLAAAYAHEIVTTQRLAEFEETALREINERRAEMEKVPRKLLAFARGEEPLPERRANA